MLRWPSALPRMIRASSLNPSSALAVFVFGEEARCYTYDRIFCELRPMGQCLNFFSPVLFFLWCSGDVCDILEPLPSKAMWVLRRIPADLENFCGSSELLEFKLREMEFEGGEDGWSSLNTQLARICLFLHATSAIHGIVVSLTSMGMCVCVCELQTPY